MITDKEVQQAAAEYVERLSDETFAALSVNSLIERAFEFGADYAINRMISEGWRQ